MKQVTAVHNGVRVEHQDGTVVVSAAGELDIATVPALRAALTEVAGEGVERLVVDLSGVTFIDSVGVGAVLHSKRRLGPGGRMAVVLTPESYARVIFDVVGADSLVEVVETLEEAAARLAA